MTLHELRKTLDPFMGDEVLHCLDAAMARIEQLEAEVQAWKGSAKAGAEAVGKIYKAGCADIDQRDKRIAELEAQEDNAP